MEYYRVCSPLLIDIREFVTAGASMSAAQTLGRCAQQVKKSAMFICPTIAPARAVLPFGDPGLGAERGSRRSDPSTSSFPMGIALCPLPHVDRTRSLE